MASTTNGTNGLVLATTFPLYLLDTNVFVQCCRQNPVGRRIEAEYKLLSTPKPPLYSLVTEAEIRSFAARNNWGQPKREQLGFLLGAFRRVSPDVSGVLDAYVQIDVFSHKAGVQMGKNDLWIAATAAATGATLLTTDKDFDHLDSRFLSRIWINPAP